jgi:hypothetical protein
MNVSPVDAALKVHPEPFDAVHGRAGGRYILARRVVSGVMEIAHRAQSAVSKVLVGVDCRMTLHGVTNDWEKRSATAVRNDLSSDIAAAFHHAENDHLSSAAHCPALISTDERLVDLNLFGEATDRPVAINRAHVFTDGVAHAPCGFVGHSKLAFHFLCCNAVSRCAKLEHDKEPIAQRSAGALKRRPGSRVNLKAAMFAGVRAARLNPVKTGFASASAAVVTRAVARAHQVIEATFFGRETSLKLAKGWGFRFHTDCMPQALTCRKGIIAKNLTRGGAINVTIDAGGACQAAKSQ